MSRIGWNRVLPDARPGHYYVTARDSRGRTAFLLGPYTQQRHGQTAHARALANVLRAKRWADENTREGRLFPDLLYGTARLPLNVTPPRAVMVEV